MKNSVPVFRLFLFAAFSLVLAVSFGQNLEIKDKKGKTGLFNAKTKVWVVAPVYQNIHVIPWVKKDTFYCYQAVSKKGSLLLDKNGKPIPGAAFKSMEYLHYKKFFKVEAPKGYAVYELGKGINAEIGYFDQVATENYYGIGKRFFMHQNGKWAVVDVRKPVKPVHYYDEITQPAGVTNSGGKIFMVREGKKYGITDSMGIPLFKPVYDSLEAFYSQRIDPPIKTYFAARNEGKWGIINVYGIETAPFQFDSLAIHRLTSSSVNDVEPVLPARMGAWWGVIDTTGKFVIPREYDHVPVIGEDKRVLVYKNHKTGIVDFSGRTVFPFLYSNIEKTSYNALDARRFPNYLFSLQNDAASSTDTTSAWGICDSTGKIIHPANGRLIRLSTKYRGNNPDLTDYDDSTFIGWLWNEGGCKFKMITQSDSMFTEDEMQGHMVVAHRLGDGFSGGRTGIIDKAGKIQLPVKYEELLLPLYQEKDGEFFGMNYVSVFKPSRRLREDYKVDNTYPIIACLNSKWGVCDWKGKPLVPFEFDSIRLEYSGSNYFDMNDSLMKVNHFTRQVFKVYKNGMIGFYSPAGKELLHPHEKFTEIASAAVCHKGMTFLLPEIKPATVSNFNVVRKDFSLHKFDVMQGGMLYDPTYGDYVESMMAHPYIVSTGGKLNFMNSATYTMLFKEWVDDVILKSTEDSSGPVKMTIWSDMRSQLKNSFVRNDDIKEPAVPYDPQKEELTFLSMGTFDNVLFYKLRGQWFLFDVGEHKTLNEGAGFDSVWVMPQWFTAYRKGLFESFSYSHKGTFDVQLQLEEAIFPDDERMKLVARNCSLEYKRIPYKRSVILRLDHNGYELPDTIMVDVMTVPFVRSGKFNIYSPDRKPMLKEWVDEIMFPATDWNERFSLQDTSSIAYRVSKIEEGKNMVITVDYKKSMALRQGKLWKLVSLQHPGKTVDGLESVKSTDGLWEVVKLGKTLYYYVDQLEVKN